MRKEKKAVEVEKTARGVLVVVMQMMAACAISAVT